MGEEERGERGRRKEGREGRGGGERGGATRTPPSSSKGSVTLSDPPKTGLRKVGAIVPLPLVPLGLLGGLQSPTGPKCARMGINPLS